MKLFDPVGSVFSHELANGATILTVEVEGVAPLIVILPREVIVGVAANVIAIGAEVVVNHVQNHADALLMCSVNKSAEIIGRAIEARRGEEIRPVVTPTKAAGKFRNGHHFEQCDAGLF